MQFLKNLDTSFTLVKIFTFFLFFLNLSSLHTRLKSHYEAWKRKNEKEEKEGQKDESIQTIYLAPGRWGDILLGTGGTFRWDLFRVEVKWGAWIFHGLMGALMLNMLCTWQNKMFYGLSYFLNLFSIVD